MKIDRLRQTAPPTQTELFEDQLFNNDEIYYRELFLNADGQVERRQTVSDWLDDYWLQYIATKADA